MTYSTSLNESLISTVVFSAFKFFLSLYALSMDNFLIQKTTKAREEGNHEV
jgi:hypothetical protein